MTTQEFRRNLSSKPCIICHELNPNITTLCCLSSVHLVCLSRWINMNPTCMVCRSELVPTRTTAAITEHERNSLDISYDESSEEEEEESNNNNDNGIMNFETYYMEDSSALSHEESDYPDFNSESEVDEEEEEDDDDDNEVDSDSEYSVGSREQPHCTSCWNKAALSCVKKMCGTCCKKEILGSGSCKRHLPSSMRNIPHGLFEA